MSGSSGIPPTNLSALQVAGVPTMGMGGLPPFTGQWFFVDETHGSDGFPGTADQPLATLYRAQQLATADQDDVVCLIGTVHLSPTLDYVNSAGKLVWAKNRVHLIGLAAPEKRGKRARISVTGSTAFSYLVDVSAQGCWFMNFGTFYGFAVTGSTTPICWRDTGGRNCYSNVEFMGFGDETATTGTSNQTGARAFVMNTANGESAFYGCTFGVDTRARGATNYTVELAGGAPRLTFDHCTFEAYIGASGASGSHLLVGSAGIDRYVEFRDCAFLNAVGSAATAMTQCLNISGTAGGNIFLTGDTLGNGFTNWETSASARVFSTHAAVAASDQGIAVAVAPT